MRDLNWCVATNIWRVHYTRLMAFVVSKMVNSRFLSLRLRLPAKASILRVFQFYVLRGRAWISKLCNGTYCSRVMTLYKYLTAARSSWDWERHRCHAAPTCQEGNIRYSGPRTDEVRTVRDGLPRCCGVAEAKNDAENYSCSFALADMHSCG